MSIHRRKLSNGKIVYDLRYRSQDGTQHKKTFDIKRQALQYEANLKIDQLNGTWINPKNAKVTLENYSLVWISSRLDLRLRTREVYNGLLKHHILPQLGKTEVSKLSVAQIRKWYFTLMEDGLSQATAAKTYRLLRTILNCAISESLIKTNPCNVKGAGQDKSSERPIATLEEVFELADAIDRKFRLAVLLGTFGSLRLGEILALETDSIDLATGIIHIDKQVQELSDGTQMVAEPKTKAGLRNVSLPHFMIDELKTHVELFISETTTAFLFTSSNGNPIRRKVLQRSWNEARNKVGLPELHFHDLRHTGNTLAAMTGASIKELMARMGHASSVAALRYQHATLDRDLLIANKLNSMVTKTLMQ